MLVTRRFELTETERVAITLGVPLFMLTTSSRRAP